MPEGDEVKDGRVGIGLMVCRFTAEGTWRWCFSSTVETKTAKLDSAVDLCLIWNARLGWKDPQPQILQSLGSAREV
jgi:hypothetical protein